MIMASLLSVFVPQYCPETGTTCTLSDNFINLSDYNMFLFYEKWISAEISLNKKRSADVSLFMNYAFEIASIPKMLNKKPHEINILEFGMGWGFWANVAKAFNFNVAGSELSEERIKFAENNGLKVIQDISKEQDESYDYVYANQVFEHLPNPAEIIKDLSRVMKKGGIIHIQVPNGQKIERKLKSKNWKAQKDAIQPLEHINCYNGNSLKTLAFEADLTPIPPPFNLRATTIKSLFRSQWKYLYKRFYSTEMFFKKYA